MDERGKGRCSLCRDTDHPISRPTFHPCFIIFDFLTAPGGSSFLFSSRKHIAYICLKKACFEKLWISKGSEIPPRRNVSIFYATESVLRERHSFRFRPGIKGPWKPTCPRSIRFDSTRLSDGWKRGTNAAIIGQTGEHSTLFRSRETNRETIEENQ